MRIGAAILVRNMAPSVGATVRSLSWTDGIYLYDDGSTDATVAVARTYARVPLHIESAINPIPAFDSGEEEVRNHVLARAFNILRCDALISVDADELVASSLRSCIEESLSAGNHYDTISLSMWHLYTTREYLHFWETQVNGVAMLDPHTRVLTPGRQFEDIFPDGRHPAIRASDTTLCLQGPYHFHVKYTRGTPYRNACLPFLPAELTPAAVRPFLRNLPFPLPLDVRQALRAITWSLDGGEG